MPGEHLRVVSGPAGGTEIPIEHEFEIGRAADEQGRLGDDDELSRRHARVFHDGHGNLVIDDLGSMNGTFVNGKRIQSPTVLRAGDSVQLGQSTLTVLDSSGRALQPTAYAGSRRPSDTKQGAVATVASGTPVTPSGGGGRGGMPRWAPWGALGLVALAAVVVAVVLLTGSSDSKNAGTKSTPTAAATATAVAALTTQQLIEKGKPSTVQINVKAVTREPPTYDKGVGLFGGTGWVVDADKGLVVTNAHVVAGATSLKVKLADGTDVNARIEGESPCEDLAVLSLRPVPSGLQAATLGVSADVNPGDTVIALGYPGAFEQDFENRALQGTTGTVTAATGAGDLGDALPHYASFIQHQAPVNHGNSGGPLFNQKGEVIGVNTFGNPSGQGQYGAIAIDRVKAQLKSLQRRDDSSYVGWSLVPYSARYPGLIVLTVDAGSPADRAKIGGRRISGIDPNSPLENTTLLQVNNQDVNTMSDVCDALASAREGAPLSATVSGIPPTSAQIEVEIKP
jgi:S1-C subfamily serine protease